MCSKCIWIEERKCSVIFDSLRNELYLSAKAAELAKIELIFYSSRKELSNDYIDLLNKSSEGVVAAKIKEK